MISDKQFALRSIRNWDFPTQPSTERVIDKHTSDSVVFFAKTLYPSLHGFDDGWEVCINSSEDPILHLSCVPLKKIIMHSLYDGKEPMYDAEDEKLESLKQVLKACILEVEKLQRKKP